MRLAFGGANVAQANYPAGWLQSEQYQPNDHLSKARSNSAKEDYLAVAQRLVWFIREQRQMIAAGVATCSFVIKTKILELDSAAGSCTCEAYIRDCLGNEATDIGTETRADFKDFPEKAATKAKGRALLSLGYGTAFAPELDEGERIADAPREQKPTQAQTSKPAQTADIVLAARAVDLKNRAALVGWIGSAYSKLVCEATGKSAKQLQDQGKPTNSDLDKLEKRIILLEKAAKAEAEKADGASAANVVESEPEPEVA